MFRCADDGRKGIYFGLWPITALHHAKIAG